LSNTGISATATAVVVACDEGTRALLIGLLRLNHIWVDGEADGVVHGLELVRNRRPAFLITDAGLTDGSWEALVAGARGILPTVRVVLVGSTSNPPTPASNPAQRPDVVLLRPFRLSQFAEALIPGETKRTGIDSGG